MSKKSGKPPDRDKPVRVRFLKRDAPWNQGDVEAFPRAAAEKLVSQRVAELVKEE